MDNWNEIRTAYQVVRLGTVSAAAEALGVHRATVIRHIDALEAVLGEKIFQRHSRGYTPTEVGQDLMRVAKATDEQFSQFAGRTKGHTTELSGDFVVTSLNVVAPMLIPALNAFQAQHPGIIVQYLASDRLFRLEYGEAHVAIRAGSKPDQPDNVVQPFAKFRIGLYASAAYAARRGLPKTPDEYASHCFVGSVNPNTSAPFHIWMRDTIPETNVVFRSTSQRVLNQAVFSGTGIGFLPMTEAEQRPDLIEVMPPQENWDVSFWLVTHVDLHRTAKVQAFLNVLKETIRDGV